MSNPAEPDASELLAQARRGDKSAANRLLAQHRDRLRRMVAVRMDDRLSARLDPSDVVQETLALAAQQLAGYLRDPPLPLYPWLRQIAWNRLTALRRRHVEAGKRAVARERPPDISNASAIQLAERFAGRESGPLRRAIRNETCRRVHAALSDLAEADREILILRHLEELSYAECAAILHVTEAAAKQRHVRALRRIRRLLGNDSSGVSP
jgi:RNA polymerase sigma-70 factor (ECF subfamily)